MKKFRLIAALFAFAATFSVLTPVSADERISSRLQPVGSVCMQGEACAAGQGGNTTTAKSPDSIYATYCGACHTTGALGAPKKGDSAAWQARLDAVGGFDALVASAIKGKGGMPAKGLCNDCSDDELAEAVRYISGQ